jgi:hypothetical protein
MLLKEGLPLVLSEVRTNGQSDLIREDTIWAESRVDILNLAEGP